MRRLGTTLIVVFVLLVPFGIDWVTASSRLSHIDSSVTLNPPAVVADGKSTIVVTVRFSEDGKPRANDVLQIWLDVGGGVLPQWVITNQDGVATIKFSPNPLTQYDVQDHAEMHIMNTSIGRLIEVNKDIVVRIPLTKPTDEKPKKGIMG
jgi:hypothetical protein